VTTPSGRAAVGHLREWADAQAADADLLRRFRETGDSEALTTLVRRHGGTVLAVCRRLLPTEADAEDAFQATFLTLARRAAAVRDPAAVGSWLFGVAVRLCRKARVTARTRRAREQSGGPPTRSPDPVAAAAGREAEAIVLEEVGRLPDKFRGPLVLCGLAGLSREAAAQRLGWPEGTLSGRLAEARVRLRAALRKRGIAAPAVTVAAAAVSPALIAATVARVVSSVGTPSVVGAAALEQPRRLIAGCARGSVLALALAVAAWGAIDSAPPPPAVAAPPLKDPAGPWRKTVDLPAGDGRAATIAFSPDEKRLVVGYARAPNNGEIRVWDTVTGKEQKGLVAPLILPGYPRPDPPMSAVEAVAYAPGGKYVLASTTRNTDRAVLWDPATGDQIPPQMAFVDAAHVGFGPEGKTLVGAQYTWGERPNDQVGLDRLDVRVWETASGKEVAGLKVDAKLGNTVSTVAVSPDGKLVAWAYATFQNQADREADEKKPRGLRLWEPATGREREVETAAGGFTWAKFSADGRRLAAQVWSPEGRRLAVWDVDGLKRKVTVELSKERSPATMSPDFQLLATKASDGAVRLTDVQTGKEAAMLAGRSDATVLAFSPDGRTLAVGRKDGTVSIWTRGK
jgi:RNA polymerase sigma factor (sigma-70 family)